MKRQMSVTGGAAGAVAAALILSLATAGAQQAPKYPLDDKLAGEPAPWAVPGKWGKHGNWGRWGEDDKRGMLNYITPEMVAKAAARVKRENGSSIPSTAPPTSRISIRFSASRLALSGRERFYAVPCTIPVVMKCSAGREVSGLS